MNIITFDHRLRRHPIQYNQCIKLQFKTATIVILVTKKPQKLYKLIIFACLRNSAVVCASLFKTLLTDDPVLWIRACTVIPNPSPQNVDAVFRQRSTRVQQAWFVGVPVWEGQRCVRMVPDVSAFYVKVIKTRPSRTVEENVWTTGNWNGII